MSGVQDIAAIAWTCVKECRDHQPPPVMCVKHQLEAEEVLRSINSGLLAALLRYGHCKPGCASGWRASTGSSQIGPCDCGFAAAIEKAAAIGRQANPADWARIVRTRACYQCGAPVGQCAHAEEAGH